MKYNTAIKKRDKDLRDIVFKSINKKLFQARIIVKEEAIVAGIQNVLQKVNELDLDVDVFVNNGKKVFPGDTVIKLKGTPKKLAMGEDYLIGLLGKYSGIATAAHFAKKKAGNKVKIVSGAWKKMPFSIKKSIREAIKIGGLTPRITNKKFVYLDKNYVRMFGGVSETLEAVKNIKGIKVLQIKGEFSCIKKEVKNAAIMGANIVMIDTGNVLDLRKASEILQKLNLRNSIKLAFGGGVKIKDLPQLRKEDLDIIDIGREIVDAPLLDLSFDIIL